MKKIIISLVFIAGFASYALYSYFSTKSAAASLSSAVSVPVAATTSAAGAAPPVNTATIPVATAPVKKAAGQYTDGTYKGSVANAFYGNVQVEATISNGKIAKVSFLQYPNDRGNSIMISQRVMPILSSEAIQAQSANVDGVSGASQTSEAFNQSLASALAQA